MKISSVWAAGLICLVVGGGIGFLLGNFFAPARPPKSAGGAEAAGPMPGISMGGPPSASPGGAPGGPGGGAPGGMMGGPAGKGGARGPSAKNQLAFLITKLDLLTSTALPLTLADDQKKAVDEQVRGLDAATELTDEDAQKRLDTLLSALANCKDALVAAGYRWPGEGGFRPPANTPNPFTEEANAKALKSLQERVATEPAKQ